MSFPNKGEICQSQIYKCGRNSSAVDIHYNKILKEVLQAERNATREKYGSSERNEEHGKL